jgi:outer membrane protein
MKIHLMILYVLVLALLSLAAYNHFRAPKLAYVDNAQLFAGFKMKAELERKYQDVEKQKQNILDSLLAHIRADERDGLPAEKLDLLKQEFMYRKQSYEKENSALMGQLNAEIWNRLNGYVREFGRQKRFKIILGTSGQGTLMFAQDDLNITDELLQYANEKYNGQ